MDNQILEGRADYGMETKSELVLRAVWGKQQGKLILCPARDAITQKMRGVKTFSPEEARLQIRVVTEDTTREITDGLIIKLKDEVDMVDWEWIKECKEVAINMEEAQQSHSALFYVEDLDREVIERVKLDDLRFEAKRLIKASSDFRKSEIVKLLGREPKYMRPIDIADFLNDLSYKKPTLVTSTYNDEDYKIKLFIYSLLDLKIIHKDNNGFYKYENVILGVNEAATIHWLKDDANKTMVHQFHQILNPTDFKKPTGTTEETETKLEGSVEIEEIADEIPKQETPVRILHEEAGDMPKGDAFGPFKGTEDWNKLSPQAKGKINKARKADKK